MADLADPALRLQSVAKRLGGRPVLRGLDLHVARGEAVAVLGPNGSGKSTLLRVAAGQSRPDAGQAQRQGRVSYLAQDAPLYAELTPAEHVRWWSRLWALPAGEEATLAALGEAGLLRLAHRPAGTLSRGERQRLALTLAFLPPPSAAPLLVLDEPFAALDDVAHQWLESRLAARRAQGGTVLLALHGEEAARRVAGRVVHLAHGRATESAESSESAPRPGSAVSVDSAAGRRGAT